MYENLNLRPPTDDEPAGDREAGKEPEVRTIGGEVCRSAAAGLNWRETNYADKLLVTTVRLAISVDGGKTWSDLERDQQNLFKENFGDARTFWIDPGDSGGRLMKSRLSDSDETIRLQT